MPIGKFEMRTLEKRTHSTTLNVPEEFLVRIGRIIVLWAYAENQLYQFIYDVANIGPKYGRLIVQKLGPDKLISVLENLLLVADKKLNATEEQVKTWRAMVKTAAEERDHFAHGIWSDIPGQPHPCLQLTRGEHVVVDNPRPDLRARKIDPVSLAVSVPILDVQIAHLEKLILELPRLKAAVDSALPLPPKPALATNRPDSQNPPSSKLTQPPSA